jgi:hypothetical protein
MIFQNIFIADRIYVVVGDWTEVDVANWLEWIGLVQNPTFSLVVYYSASF